MTWILVLSTGLCLYGFSFLYALIRNYLRAIKSGLPILVCPIDPLNPFVLALNPLYIWTVARYAPDWVWIRIRHVMHGWEYVERQQRKKPVYSPGGAFIQVTPRSNILCVDEDAEMAEAVLTRKRDFCQAEVTRKLIGVFGPNVMVVEGQDWQRHRRIVTQALNGKIIKLVWEESVRQTTEMIDSTLKTNNGETDRAIEGLRNLAINVLTSAGYGESNPWDSEKKPPPSGHEITYTRVLDLLTKGFVLLAIMPAKLLRSQVMPKALREIGVAGEEFDMYAKEMLDRERAAMKTNKVPKRDFLSSVVKLSEEELHTSDADNPTQGLSKEEIKGNLWQFSVAGFDTTANTLAYAVSLLAIHPDWQNWLIEEIDQVQSPDDSFEPDEVFHRYPRCLAFMLETVRLYSPIANVGRATIAPQTIVTSSGTYHVPADTQCLVALARLHVNPKYWGKDAAEFNPARWLKEKDATTGRVLVKVEGAPFMPWSTGWRQCPGMKMAQVEFMAVMATLFRRCTIRPAIKDGETFVMAKEKIEQVLSDSQPRLTLQMNRPTDVKLVLKKR